MNTRIIVVFFALSLASFVVTAPLISELYLVFRSFEMIVHLIKPPSKVDTLPIAKTVFVSLFANGD